MGSDPCCILNELAQEWAERLARKGILQYKSDPKYGENIYISPWRNLPYDIKPKDPLESWYREGDYYKYGDNDTKALDGVCHFTQLVWKDTQSIGLGIAIAINGAFYFVCFYYPSGNIEGQFKENVLPPIEEEKELSPEEAEFIQKIKSKINVVRSMERLYAVPSEQLRVWLVWLSKVGDMADEWYKWLRSHIDFVLRLSIELRAAEEILRLERGEELRTEEMDPTKEEMKVETKIETKEMETNTKEETKEETKENAKENEKMEKKNTNNPRNTDNPRNTNNPNDEEDDDDVTEEEEREITPEEEEKAKVEEEKKKEVEENGEEVTEIEEEKVEEEEEKVEEEEEKPTIVITEEEEAIIKEWPVGIPWEHLGIEEEEEKPFDKRLPIPRNEAEMKDFLRKFTHEATAHRSSFKHWKDTADRAVKEIGNRLVIATFLVQGKDQKGDIKKPPVKKIFSPKPRKVKSMPRKDKKRKVASPARKTNGEPEETTQESKLEMSPSKRDMEIRKMLDIDADDFVKDCARGAEPLPYFFYLKVEPDIDIAMEHDDENVILADTERENINGEFQRLYFNLSDKPCKGGKPWML